MIRRVSLWCLLALCAVVTSGPAAAQGYGVYEQGACAMGRAGAAVASPCEDGSAIFFNPAAIVLQPDGNRVSAGGTLVGPRGDFTSPGGRTTGTMVKNWLPVPAAYYTKSLGDRLGGGVGVFAPFGLTTDWPVDFGCRSEPISRTSGSAAETSASPGMSACSSRPARGCRSAPGICRGARSRSTTWISSPIRFQRDCGRPYCFQPSRQARLSMPWWRRSSRPARVLAISRRQRG